MQLFPRFLVPLALYFAFRVCGGAGVRAWAALAACVVWQLYCTLYMGYFLLLLLAAFVPFCLMLRWRAEVVASVRAKGWWPLVAQVCLFVLAVSLISVKPRPAVSAALLGLGELVWYWRGQLWRGVCGGSWRQCLARVAVVAVSAAATVPLLAPYAEAARGHQRTLAEVLNLQPRLLSWVSTPYDTLVWSALDSNAYRLPSPVEHAIFLGGLPSLAVLAALGCAFARRFRDLRGFAAAGALAFATLFVFTLYTDHFCLYKSIFLLPGVNAFRAVCRIVLVLLFPAAAALAFWLTAGEAWLARRLGRAAGTLAACLALTLVAAEQVVCTGGLYNSPKAVWQGRCDRVVAQAQRQAPQARLLLDLSCTPEDVREPLDHQVLLQHLDAMMASQVLGVPTLNGYSGNVPEDSSELFTTWDLELWKKVIRNRVGERHLRRRIPGYSEHGFDGLCVVGRLREAHEHPRTGSAEPPPPEACRARLDPGELPASVEAGSTLPVVVRVTNLGTKTWPTLSIFRLGLCYHWLLPDGRKVPGLAEGRVWLFNDVAPGETAGIEADVLTPLEPGEYVLEFDMFSQGYCYFANFGSVPVRHRITCGPRHSGSPPAVASAD
jgi:hypothetical protein